MDQDENEPLPDDPVPEEDEEIRARRLMLMDDDDDDSSPDSFSVIRPEIKEETFHRSPSRRRSIAAGPSSRRTHRKKAGRRGSTASQVSSQGSVDVSDTDGTESIIDTDNEGFAKTVGTMELAFDNVTGAATEKFTEHERVEDENEYQDGSAINVRQDSRILVAERNGKRSESTVISSSIPAEPVLPDVEDDQILMDMPSPEFSRHRAFSGRHNSICLPAHSHRQDAGFDGTIVPVHRIGSPPPNRSKNSEIKMDHRPPSLQRKKVVAPVAMVLNRFSPKHAIEPKVPVPPFHARQLPQKKKPPPPPVATYAPVVHDLIKKAEEAEKRASTAEEKIMALEELVRTMRDTLVTLVRDRKNGEALLSRWLDEKFETGAKMISKSEEALSRLSAKLSLRFLYILFPSQDSPSDNGIQSRELDSTKDTMIGRKYSNAGERLYQKKTSSAATNQNRCVSVDDEALFLNEISESRLAHPEETTSRAIYTADSIFHPENAGDPETAGDETLQEYQGDSTSPRAGTYSSEASPRSPSSRYVQTAPDAFISQSTTPHSKHSPQRRQRSRKCDRLVGNAGAMRPTTTETIAMSKSKSTWAAEVAAFDQTEHQLHVLRAQCEAQTAALRDCTAALADQQRQVEVWRRNYEAEHSNLEKILIRRDREALSKQIERKKASTWAANPVARELLIDAAADGFGDENGFYSYQGHHAADARGRRTIPAIHRAI